MKNSLYVSMFSILIVISSAAQAQEPVWTWVDGENYYNSSGTSGQPGGRQAGVSWIDSDKNLWFFGGYGRGRNSTAAGLLNGLWKFNGSDWILEKGWDSVTDISYQTGVYGTKGSSDSSNMPGARWNAVSWTGTGATDGYLYLFGGSGYDTNGTSGYLNDLWRFNLSSKNWTWVAGSNAVWQYGIYGTMGQAATSNTPGARGWSATCVDSNGTLWLFGGYGYGSSGSFGFLNDLWKYSSSKWTWINGSKSINRRGVYGTKDIAGADSMPGGRYGSVMWMDTKGNLWIYGGAGYDSRGSGGYLRDLWKFDGTNWTWVNGSNLVERHYAGVYGTKGQPNADNKPGCREEFAAWRDNYGYLWVFGGAGFDKNEDYGVLNDLWKYNGSVWEWVAGSDTISESGTYGTQGVPDSDNTPGARSYSVSCTDTNDLWLFGGNGYDEYGSDGNLNDLWKFSSIVPEGIQLRVFDDVNEIISGQIEVVNIGTAPVRITGPTKKITIRNNGSETLILDVPFAEPNHFIITQPADSILAPGDETSFTVRLNTDVIGSFEETFFFNNNDVDNNSFTFTIEGTVVPWQFGNLPGNTSNTKFITPDACGVSVTFALTGGGYGEIAGDVNFEQINLFGTTEKSVLTISSKLQTSIGDIDSNGPVKSIKAKNANLRGNITIAGSLVNLLIKDVNNSTDHTISIGSSTNPKLTSLLVFGRAADLTINSDMPLKAISSIEWLDGRIDAPSIIAIVTKGNKKLGIAGDLNLEIQNYPSITTVKAAGTISGAWNCTKIKSLSASNINDAVLSLDQEPNLKVLALGSLKVKNHITDSQIISDGNVGTISVGAMINSLCFAGIKSDVNGLADLPSDINVPASFKNISIKGVKGEPNAFINSNIAAETISTASLKYPQTDNESVPFGISAGFIKSLKIKNASSAASFKNLTLPADNNDFDDFKIRLY